MDVSATLEQLERVLSTSATLAQLLTPVSGSFRRSLLLLSAKVGARDYVASCNGLRVRVFSWLELR